jgi:4-hydroxybenzoate polyprenyltransferase
METAVSSRSIATELCAYAGTRLLRLHVLALGIVVGACGAAASPARLAVLATSVALAMAMVWQFRLWDDLADIAYDRAHHPERILVGTGALRSFRRALVLSALCLAPTLAMARGTLSVALYAALAAALALAYRCFDAYPGARLLRSHLVLAKYPVLVWITAAQPDALRALAIGLGLYLALCVFEIFDDPRLRGSPNARRLAIAEGVALLGMLAYGAIR